MQPPAHRPPTPCQIENARICRLERDLFFRNLDLILAHQAEILRCDEYFFCRPAFAGYGMIFYSGHINLGALLLGWRNGIFMDKCGAKLGSRKGAFSCLGKAYVYSFGGSGGGTRWSAFCATCQLAIGRRDEGRFQERMAFVSAINNACESGSKRYKLSDSRRSDFLLLNRVLCRAWWQPPGRLNTIWSRRLRLQS